MPKEKESKMEQQLRKNRKKLRKNSYQGMKMNPTKHHRSHFKFYAILFPIAAFMVMPLVFIINHAFKPLNELFAFPPRFFVIRPTLDNFRSLFASRVAGGVPMSRYLFNSLFVSIIVVFLTIIISTMAAYALSKKNFKAKKLMFEVNTIALMFVPIAVAIPRYLIIANLGMVDTMFAHVLPLLAMPVGLFLVKQFIDQLPNELIEAAKIDGANDFRIYWSIVMPLIKPAIATMGILAFQAVWNNVETSDIFINDESLRTLAFYMQTLTGANNTIAGAGTAAAAALVMFIPNLVIFIFMQSKVMDTMAHSGIK